MLWLKGIESDMNRPAAKQPVQSDLHGLLAEMLVARWRQYRKRLKACRQQASEEAVHDLRVAVRRLLSAFDFIEHLCGPAGLEKARRQLRRYLDCVAELRDVHVQLQLGTRTCAALPGLVVLKKHLSKQEQRCQKAARKQLKRLKTRRVREVVRRAVERLQKQAGTGRATAEQRRRALRALTAAFEKVARLRARLDATDMKTFHRLRVAFKRFRYMAEMLSPLLPDFDARKFAQMRHYQRRLGDIQDANVLLATLEKLAEKRKRERKRLEPLHQKVLQRRQRLVVRFLKSADQLSLFKPGGG